MTEVIVCDLCGKTVKNFYEVSVGVRFYSDSRHSEDIVDIDCFQLCKSCYDSMLSSSFSDLIDII